MRLCEAEWNLSHFPGVAQELCLGPKWFLCGCPCHSPIFQQAQMYRYQGTWGRIPRLQKRWHGLTFQALLISLGLVSLGSLALTHSLPDLLCESHSTNPVLSDNGSLPFVSGPPLGAVQGSWCGRCSAWGSSPMTCMTTPRWFWRSPRATGSTGPTWHRTPSTRSCTAAGTRQVYPLGGLEGVSGTFRVITASPLWRSFFEGKHLAQSRRKWLSAPALKCL